jgi:hypothetical protein
MASQSKRETETLYVLGKRSGHETALKAAGELLRPEIDLPDYTPSLAEDTTGIFGRHVCLIRIPFSLQGLGGYAPRSMNKYVQM